MSKPAIHAESSVRRYGGKVEDYLPIHSFMDSSKGAIASNMHRALTHNSWFLMTVLERVKFPNSIESPDFTFPTFKNSDGRIISVRSIGEDHIAEDFGGKFIPSAQDYLAEMEFKGWMNNGAGVPPSFTKIEEKKVIKVRRITFDKD